MHNQLAVISLATVLILSGCGSTPQLSNPTQDTATGAGVGTGAGALISAIAGGGKGADIGGAPGAVPAAPAASVGNVWSRRMEEQKKAMEQATAGTGVQVVKTADNRLKLDIPSDISFDAGSAKIKPDFRPVLDNLATSVVNNPGAEISIIGHTDSSGSDVANNPLSLNRAASTGDYLVSRGVSATRITIDGHGWRRPLVSDDTPANRAKNRCVEIFVAEPQAPSQRISNK
ncbi:MAG TPA: OmpA family protein [Nitrosospira sp.]|nr:OmpA family protein [Nitrosospira sp.]